jgi:flagellar hook-associated protein 3 FlgL
MRVTDSISYRNFLFSSERLNSQLDESSLQVSSGRRLTHLSDGPGESGQLVLLRTQIAQIDQYRASADTVRYYLNVSETSLDSIHNVYTSIFAKASEAASETTNTEGRAALAREVRALRDQLLGLANTKVQGRYLFAGSLVTTTPFSIAGDTVTYNGNADVNTVVVDSGLSVQANVPGGAALAAIFDNIEALLAGMDSNNLGAIGAALAQFEPAKSGLAIQRDTLGTALAQLDDLAGRHDARENDIKTRKSAFEDVNMAEAVTDLSRIETALRAAMGAGARLDDRNLFDYLG